MATGSTVAVVVGAGATGILVALKLARAGIEVVLVEEGRAGDGQSNHSHGYMHRGHIYLNPSASLVRDLNRGADEWACVMDQAGIKPVAQTAAVAFSNPIDSRIAEVAWSRAGMEFEPVESIEGIDRSRFTSAFRTREAVFDFTPWLARSVDELRANPNCRVLAGRALSLRRRGDTIASVVVSDGTGGVHEVRANQFILCAGVDNQRLATTATHFRGNSVIRSSMMLVVEGAELPPVAIVAHGHEWRGLFIASRPAAMGNRWLISNYVSFSGVPPTRRSSSLWLKDVAKAVRNLAPSLRDPNCRWGYYAAPKAELRNSRHQLGSFAAQTYGIENLRVAAPTKLTLAPLLAASIAEEIIAREPERTPVGVAPRKGYSTALSVASERWKEATLGSYDALLEELR